MQKEIYVHIYEGREPSSNIGSWNDALQYLLDYACDGYIGTFYKPSSNKSAEFINMHDYLAAYLAEELSWRAHTSHRLEAFGRV